VDRAVNVATCLGLMFAGFGLGTAVVFGSPWSIPANLLVAVLVGLIVAVVEILSVRRFGSKRAKQLLLLAGVPFPFAAVGVGAAILFFGTH
jgi:membrane protein implicated in regulation of membrane protease activity